MAISWIIPRFWSGQTYRFHIQFIRKSYWFFLWNIIWQHYHSVIFLVHAPTTSTSPFPQPNYWTPVFFVPYTLLNTAARVILLKLKPYRITSLLTTLHWFYKSLSIKAIVLLVVYPAPPLVPPCHQHSCTCSLCPSPSGSSAVPRTSQRCCHLKRLHILSLCTRKHCPLCLQISDQTLHSPWRFL